MVLKAQETVVNNLVNKSINEVMRDSSHIAKFYSMLCKGILLKTTVGLGVYFSCTSKKVMEKIVVEEVESKENTDHMLAILKKEPYERSDLEIKRLSLYIGSKKAFKKYDGQEK